MNLKDIFAGLMTYSNKNNKNLFDQSHQNFTYHDIKYALGDIIKGLGTIGLGKNKEIIGILIPLIGDMVQK